MFAVHITHYYYRGTLNRPDDGLLRDDNGNVMTFQTHDAALSEIRRLEPSANYRLQHGEYSPPRLTLRKYNG
jgi:hypothetical protein